ncbi:MAG: class I tRNA ligase family protein, partial [Dehalococcoidia bacterium]|nr:class I tRNA ligase family protein [Dehalococcoidia bacterium]
IHGGGQDLVFPHHENEIAQSEAFTGISPFARYWLHNGLMQFGEEKMSKSLGNLITVKEALERYSTDAIRLFVLSSHYRSPLTYTEDGLEAAHRGAVRLRLAAHRENVEGPPAPDYAVYRQRFTEAMDDDFNTAQAIAALFDFASDINRAADQGHSVEEAQRELIELAGVMGLTFKGYRFSVDINAVVELAVQIGITLKKDATDDECIQQIVDKRQEKRLKREWADADEIRDKLAKLGVTQEDTPQGTVWRYKR